MKSFVDLVTRHYGSEYTTTHQHVHKEDSIDKYSPFVIQGNYTF